MDLSTDAPTIESLPDHVAIIMDGNRRWARNNKLKLIEGHQGGAKRVRDILEVCSHYGIRYLTLYAFSKENWQRPEKEVNALMNLLRHYLRDEVHYLLEHHIRLRVIGERAMLPDDVIQTIQQVEEQTHTPQAAFDLVIALDYGSQQEIITATKALAQDVVDGKLDCDAIDQACFSRYLYTAAMPEPDLLIRTGGEYRLSNFLLWQSAYTELYFTNVLWPDFRQAEMVQSLVDFSQRERRYGTL